MRRKAPQIGDTIKDIRFAWLPKRVEGWEIWFEYYEATYMYTEVVDSSVVGGYKVCKWVWQEDKLCENSDRYTQAGRQ